MAAGERLIGGIIAASGQERRYGGERLTQKLEIDVPDDLAGELTAYQGRMQDVLVLGLRQIKIDEALALYRRGLISFGRAVELAGVGREELVRQAHATGVEPDWMEDTVREELS
jgi:hypothetical protein